MDLTQEDLPRLLSDRAWRMDYAISLEAQAHEPENFMNQSEFLRRAVVQKQIVAYLDEAIARLRNA